MRTDRAVASMLIASIIGGLLEIVQSILTTYRYFDIFDVIANCIGAIIGIVIMRLSFIKMI